MRSSLSGLLIYYPAKHQTCAKQEKLLEQGINNLHSNNKSVLYFQSKRGSDNPYTNAREAFDISNSYIHHFLTPTILD